MRDKLKSKIFYIALIITVSAGSHLTQAYGFSDSDSPACNNYPENVKTYFGRVIGIYIGEILEIGQPPRIHPGSFGATYQGVVYRVTQVFKGNSKVGSKIAVSYLQAMKYDPVSETVGLPKIMFFPGAKLIILAEKNQEIKPSDPKFSYYLASDWIPVMKANPKNIKKVKEMILCQEKVWSYK